MSAQEDKEFALELSISATLICNETLYPTSVEIVLVTFEVTEFLNKSSGKISNEIFQRSKLDFLYNRNLTGTEERWKQIEVRQCQRDKKEVEIKTHF